MTFEIRPAQAADHQAIGALLRDAFNGGSVDVMVEQLRASSGHVPEFELVAADGSGVVGHVMLTHLPLKEAAAPVLTLSPLAVRPDRQRKGIARALVEDVLGRADRAGEQLVVLEGDPRLYKRFGFAPARVHALDRPSPTIPGDAFQVFLLSGYTPELRGRLSYPEPFWAAFAPTYTEPLAAFERYAGWIESVAPRQLDRPIPACAGWDNTEVLRHLGVVYRVVAAWIRDGRRPNNTPSRPSDGDVMTWFEEGWRALYAILAAAPPETPAATWSPSDNSLGFWRRRMAHETIIHAHDVLGDAWSVSEELALDGIDEALRLWLATRVGTPVGGTGQIIRVSAGRSATCPVMAVRSPASREVETWTVGLHETLLEVHQQPAEPHATIEGSPADVYTWLWGRTDNVQRGGDLGLITQLRGLLERVM